MKTPRRCPATLANTLVTPAMKISLNSFGRCRGRFVCQVGHTSCAVKMNRLDAGEPAQVVLKICVLACVIRVFKIDLDYRLASGRRVLVYMIQH